MTFAVSIQARLGSTRLPGKVLFPLGDRRVLGWVVHRAEQVRPAEHVVIAVGDEPENEAIAEWCRRNNHDFLAGPEDDLLARHRMVLERTRADTLVRITGDCPFCPPDEAIRLIEEYQTTDARYVTNLAETMPIGTAVDVIDGALLDQLAAAGETHPVRAIRDSPDQYAMRISPNPDWEEVADAHTAVDTPADYWRLIDAMAEVGPDPHDVAAWIIDE